MHDHEDRDIPGADQPEGLPNLGETVVEVIAMARDDELRSDAAAPACLCEIVATVEPDGTDLPGTELVLLVRSRLEQHPHFRGRSSLFAIELVGETIVMTGQFPSFYLKQPLQEVIKVLPGVVSIDNQVQVVWPNT
jgi:hypothetical protein